MIRHGKRELVLAVSPESFGAWMKLTGIEMHEVKVDNIPGKGSGLLASRSVTNSAAGAECLLTVPKSSILSLEMMRTCALIDRDYNEVLECVGDLGMTARGAILVYFLVQIAHACISVGRPGVGVQTTFIHYIKSLPQEGLPTTWTQDELKLLVGTTLAPATAQKLRSLRREYDHLCSAAARTRWWNAVSEKIEFEDWLIVDAMYRSRALDYPGIGHCLVPCLDIANHASGDATVAVYEEDSDGNAILLLRDGNSLAEGDEVTISYGDEKGACEMLFSYGFIEDGCNTAEALYLDLSPAPDDPFGSEKHRFAQCAPGFKIMDAGDGKVDWKGDYVWLLCLYPEDGLHFDLAELVDGGEEVQAFWGEHDLKNGAASLYSLLGKSELWDVWRLRALSILQARIGEQLSILTQTQDLVEATKHGKDTNIDSRRYDLANKLRVLEFELLARAYDDFNSQMNELAQSEVVVRYLAAQRATDLNETEDFS